MLHRNRAFPALQPTEASIPSPVSRKPILVVVTPFLDKRHGTERCVAEQVDRLAESFDVHIYSSRVEGLDTTRVTWHRVPIPRGPELFRFVSWFAANAFFRWRNRVRGFRPDVSYSPGPNCLHPDIVSVHAVFAKMRRIPRHSSHDRVAAAAWPRRIHRRLYYALAERIERLVYSNESVRLMPVSSKTKQDLSDCFGAGNRGTVSYPGVDVEVFSPGTRASLRSAARAEFALDRDSIAVLLIGNDWATKGLNTLVDAVRVLNNSCVSIFAVGSDRGWHAAEVKAGAEATVRFFPERPDVERFYAGADIYASPSLEDSFALPVLEAMACGLPVVTSRAAGVSELIHHGEDGLILEDPRDAQTLAQYLRNLISDAELRLRLGVNAARTASQYTWERNAAQLRAAIDDVLSRRPLP